MIRCCCSTACRARWRAGRISPTRFKTELSLHLTRPGVGASETPVVPYSMPMLADIAARVLDAFGIEKADVVGYSHGGAVAQQLAVGHRSPREPTRAACDGLWSRRGSRASPRCHPTLADAKSRNAVAAPGSVGLALADRCHLDLVQHPRSRLHRCTHPGGLRRLRPGRPAGEQSATCGAHPRRPPCHDPGRTRSAEARHRQPLWAAWWSSFLDVENFDAATRIEGGSSEGQRPQYRLPARRSTREPRPTSPVGAAWSSGAMTAGSTRRTA